MHTCGRSDPKRTTVIVTNALLFALFSALAGCADLPRKPVPIDQIPSAQVAGISGIRAVGLTQSEEFQDDLVRSWAAGGQDNSCAESDGRPIFCVLVLSGGGGFGAFGAGVLNGLTANGTRPNFRVVTGISTGALIAPFAFLGPDYDDELKKAFTTISDKDVFTFRGVFALFTDESLADSEPLSRLIASYVDEEFLAAIAREHKRGRRLYVGTTNMDAQQFVAWNMGAIAASGHPAALALFRKVILGSASIPVVFPPVMIDVDLDGSRFDEMHADGGVETQFFFPGDVLNFNDSRLKSLKGGSISDANFRMFVVRNGRFQPVAMQVKRGIPSIAGRAVESMIQSMGRADLYRLYAVASVRGVDFNYVEMPADFEWQSDDEFDRAEMNRLFNVGSEMARQRDVWHKTPPGTFSKNLQIAR